MKPNPTGAAPEAYRGPQPGELWSLFDMLGLYASAFATFVDRMGDFRKGDESLLPNWAKELPLKSALKQLRHIEYLEELGGLKEAQLFDEIKQLNRRFREDLESMRFYYVRPELESYYDDDKQFGDDVFNAFPKARDDLSEAGKCLALGRNKASVCHLMLAMEHALRALAEKMKASVLDKDDKWLPWLKITNNLEPIIRALPEGDKKVAWWEVHSMLLSVGKAWRNPSMHPADSYDEAQARKVFEAVKGFMSDLALLV